MASDAGHRLRRAKSGPFSHRRRQPPPLPGPVDLGLGRIHATAAATRAMAQARRKSSQEYSDSRSSEDMTCRLLRSSRYPHQPPSVRCRDNDASNMSIPPASPTVPYVPTVSNETESPADILSIREFQGYGYPDFDAPSSYRRLRKARSMFSTRERANASISKVQIDTGPAISQHALGNDHKSVRHSISFYRSLRGLRRSKSMIGRSVDVEFGLPIQDSPPECRQSLLSKKLRHEQKTLRKTVRPMREYSPDEDVGVRARSRGGFHLKARVLSLNIKKRLKRVFGHSDSVGDQHSEPQSIGSGSCPAAVYMSDSPFGNIDSPSQVLRSKRSSESVATSTSRVTSWADSTAANTIATRHPVDTNSRLSIIDEDADVEQSISADERYPAANEQNGTRKPRRVVETQRVYSALMKRISEAAAKEGERIISSGTVRGGISIPAQVSPEHSQSAAQSIRRMSSDTSMETARTSFPAVSHLQSSPSRRSTVYRTGSDYRANSPTAHRSYNLASARSRLSLRDSESTFFPTTPPGKPKTPSPYRLAMKSLRKAEDRSGDTGSDTTYKMRVPDSPSIYSRTPSGHALSRENLSQSPDSLRSAQPGMATIFNEQTAYASPNKKAGITEEWMSWMHAQINSLDTLGPVDSTTQAVRAHRREGAEMDGNPMRIDDPHDKVPCMSGIEERGSIRRARGTSFSHHEDTRVTSIGRRVTGSRNFSRPLSRQSMGSLRLVTQKIDDGNFIHRLDNASGGILRNDQRDQLAKEATELSSLGAGAENAAESNHSLTPMMSLRAARKARLNRSPIRQATIRHVTDKNDARALSFHSVRSVPEWALKENRGASPGERDLRSLEGLHSTIDSKRLVDIFLNSRRGPREKSEDDTERAFV